jgi:hypothetical protein
MNGVDVLQQITLDNSPTFSIFIIMQTAIYGSYSNGVVTLDEAPKEYDKARVVVLFLKKDEDSLILSRKKKNSILTKNDFSSPFIDTQNWHFNREEANLRNRQKYR